MCQCSPLCAPLNFYSQLWCSGGGFAGGLEEKYTMPFKPHWAEVGILHHTRESNWAGRKTSLLHAARASQCWVSDVESGRGRGGKGWQKGAAAGRGHGRNGTAGCRHRQADGRRAEQHRQGCSTHTAGAPRQPHLGSRQQRLVGTKPSTSPGAIKHRVERSTRRASPGTNEHMGRD